MARWVAMTEGVAWTVEAVAARAVEAVETALGAAEEVVVRVAMAEGSARAEESTVQTQSRPCVPVALAHTH